MGRCRRSSPLAPATPGRKWAKSCHTGRPVDSDPSGTWLLRIGDTCVCRQSLICLVIGNTRHELTLDRRELHEGRVQRGEEALALGRGDDRAELLDRLRDLGDAAAGQTFSDGVRAVARLTTAGSDRSIARERGGRDLERLVEADDRLSERSVGGGQGGRGDVEAVHEIDELGETPASVLVTFAVEVSRCRGRRAACRGAPATATRRPSAIGVSWRHRLLEPGCAAVATAAARAAR